MIMAEHRYSVRTLIVSGCRALPSHQAANTCPFGGRPTVHKARLCYLKHSLYLQILNRHANSYTKHYFLDTLAYFTYLCMNKDQT